MFATPVVYPLALARSRLPPLAYRLYILNPLAGIVDAFRRGVLMHDRPDLDSLMSAALVATVVLPIAYCYFKYTELTMADVV